jgi:hypothetical protein
MIDVSPDAVTAMNLAAFAAFSIIGGLQIYVGRSSSRAGKGFSFPWINMSFGTFLIGLNYLIQAIFTSGVTDNPTITISSYLLILGGAALSFTSFFILYTESSDETRKLKEREEELKEIMDRLKKKFLSRELPEEEMKKLDTDIVRELAEIEVKLDKINRNKNKTA